MIPSQYSDSGIQDHGFMKHIHHVMVDMGVYPDGGRLVEVYKVVLRENSGSAGAGGGKPRNIELYRKALGPAQDPSAGTWIRLEKWDGDGTGDYDDASASGSVAVDEKTGDVHVMLVFGKLVNGVVRFQDWEQTVKRNTFAPPIVRPAATGVPGPRGATGATGPAGPKGDPGPAGGGTGAGLTADQLRVLNYLVGAVGPLLNG